MRSRQMFAAAALLFAIGCGISWAGTAEPIPSVRRKKALGGNRVVIQNPTVMGEALQMWRESSNAIEAADAEVRRRRGQESDSQGAGIGGVLAAQERQKKQFEDMRDKSPEQVRNNYEGMIKQIDESIKQSQRADKWFKSVSSAQKLFDQKKWMEVVDHLKPILEAESDDSIPPMLEIGYLERSYLELGKFDDVARLYEWALNRKVQIENPFIRISLSKRVLKHRTRIGRGGESQFNGFLFVGVEEADFPDALRAILCARGIGIDPGHKDYYALEAVHLFVRLKDPVKAEQYLRQISVSPGNGLSASDFLDVSGLWLDRKDAHRAQDVATLGLTAFPGDESLMSLKNVAGRGGRISSQEALQKWRDYSYLTEKVADQLRGWRQQESDPKGAGISGILAAQERQKKQFEDIRDKSPEQVRNNYEETIKQIDESIKQTHLTLKWFKSVSVAQKYFDEKRWAEVVDTLKPILENEPDKSTPPLLETYYLERAYQELGKFDDVARLYEWALNRRVKFRNPKGDGRVMEPFNGFLFAGVEEAKFPDALRATLCERGIRIDPGQKDYYALEAVHLYVRLKDAGNAERYLRQISVSAGNGLTGTDFLDVARLWLDKKDAHRAQEVAALGLSAFPGDDSLKALKNVAGSGGRIASDSRSAFADAQRAYQSGNRDAARVILEQLRAKYPDNVEYMYWLGKAANGKLAYDSFKALLGKLAPEMEHALFAEYNEHNSYMNAPFEYAFADIGGTIEGKNVYGWALPGTLLKNRVFNDRLSIQPADPEEFLYLLSLIMGDYWQSREWREIAGEVQPQWAGILFSMAEKFEPGAPKRSRYRKLLDYNNAANAFASCPELGDVFDTHISADTIARLRQAVAFQSNFGVDEAMLGHALLAQGNISEAQEHLENALTKFTRPMPGDEFRGKDFSRTMEWFGANEFEMPSAVVQEEDAWKVRQKYDTGIIKSDLAQCYFENGKYAQAERLLRQALENKVPNASEQAFIGLCKLAQGDIKGAREQLEKSMALDRKSSETLMLDGALALEEGRFDDAIRSYYQALERGKEGAPGELSVRERVRVQNSAGTAFYQKGIYDLAIENFLRALATEPESASANSNLAAAYLKKGETIKATDLLYKALGANPDDEVSQYFLDQMTHKEPATAAKAEGKKGARWAVLGLTSKGGSVSRVGLGDMASDMLTAALYERGVGLIERQAVESILQEQRLGASDLADPKTALRLGKLLTASSLVLGNVAESDQSFDVDLRVVKVETGEITGSASAQVEKKKGLRKAIAELAAKLK